MGEEERHACVVGCVTACLYFKEQGQKNKKDRAETTKEGGKKGKGKQGVPKAGFS